MRLLKLKIKNIASLKGEHLVDFGLIQSQSSLFAITGETGAGKSSILNAIGLALYGRVFKTTVNQNDVVTLGEKEGQIELIFEAKGKNYLALWRARVLKANGEPYSTPQSPTRELYQQDGSEFSSTRTITTKKADEILNLDYDQFCKCVILNQGEFARFLTSSFNERKDILEKLYPGEVLENLSRELKQQSDALFQQKTYLEIELQALIGDSSQGENLWANSQMLIEKISLLEAWSELTGQISDGFTSVQFYHQKHQDYQHRKAQTTKEFSAETTSYNSIMSLCETANFAFKAATQSRQKELPRLQRLLIAEVDLKNAQTKKNEAHKSRVTFDLKLQEVRSKLVTSHELQKGYLEKKAHLASKLNFPLEQLLAIKDDLHETFDLWGHKNQLDLEISNRQENLIILEIKGRELSVAFESVMTELRMIPADAAKQLAECILQKKSSALLQQKRQLAELSLKELDNQQIKLESEIKQTEERLKNLTSTILQLQAELSPLETSLKLQEILTAVKTCLLHQESRISGQCPVCTTPIEMDRWDELAMVASSNDYQAIEARVESLKRSTMQAQEEVKLSKGRLASDKTQLEEKRLGQLSLQNDLNTSSVNLEGLEQKIEQLQKQVWDIEKLSKEKIRTHEELNKTREAYKNLKDDILLRIQNGEKLTTRLKTIAAQWDLLLPEGLSEDNIQKLKTDAQTLRLYLNEESAAEKIHQQLDYLKASQLECEKDIASCQTILDQASANVVDLAELLKTELKSQSAQVLIEKLETQVNQAHQLYEAKNQELKKQETKLKDYRSKLYAYDEQIKDSEAFFAAGLNQVKAHASHQLPPFSEEINQLLKKLSQLTIQLQDPAEMLVPVSDLLKSERDKLKLQLSEAKSLYSGVKARLEDWEKKQDKIRLLQLKAHDILSKHGRLERLSEVLGKDELRSFVLSMVEENLIQQTNLELLHLCQGRYEIIHQTRGLRLSPEFYILDKFRDGGRRKVSTLSGGETFMVSLAMALGLAEMTRGQAEIDSLFIDEGFGTLDQESLEDVLEMLGQIQTRGLLVGIISHIKPLTSALAVNLVLNKKNDGTSTMGLRFN